jgi:hypothetical protein
MDEGLPRSAFRVVPQLPNGKPSGYPQAFRYCCVSFVTKHDAVCSGTALLTLAVFAASKLALFYCLGLELFSKVTFTYK